MVLHTRLRELARDVAGLAIATLIFSWIERAAREAKEALPISGKKRRRRAGNSRANSLLAHAGQFCFLIGSIGVGGWTWSPMLSRTTLGSECCVLSITVLAEENLRPFYVRCKDGALTEHCAPAARKTKNYCLRQRDRNKVSCGYRLLSGHRHLMATHCARPANAEFLLERFRQQLRDEWLRENLCFQPCRGQKHHREIRKK